MAVGNPLVKERVETANELSRLLTLQRKSIEAHIAMEKELTELPEKMERQQIFIQKCTEDTEYAARTFEPQDIETRRQIRKVIYDAVCANELATCERVLMTYQGFEIVLPTNMSIKKPFVWLQRRGRYYVELGDSEVGCLIRLDNVIEGLSEHLEKLKNQLQTMDQRKIALQEELQKKEDFSRQIASCKEKLNKLDKKLGVDKK